jgi:hypothetical protein
MTGSIKTDRETLCQKTTHRGFAEQQHVLTHLERVLFVDEVGSNTSQKQD